MNINDKIHFSPNYKMVQLDFSNRKEIIKAFNDRILNYYLKPLKYLINKKENDSAFSSGILCFALVDAFARYTSDDNVVKRRIINWLKINITSISKINNNQNKPEYTPETVSEKIYISFRNGLIHESHIKKGGQFSFYEPNTVNYNDEYLIINPRHFYKDLKKYFEKLIIDLNKCDSKYNIFIKRIREDFEDECEEFKELMKRKGKIIN